MSKRWFSLRAVVLNIEHAEYQTSRLIRWFFSFYGKETSLYRGLMNWSQSTHFVVIIWFQTMIKIFNLNQIDYLIIGWNISWRSKLFFFNVGKLDFFYPGMNLRLIDCKSSKSLISRNLVSCASIWNFAILNFWTNFKTSKASARRILFFFENWVWNFHLLYVTLPMLENMHFYLGCFY